MYNTWLQGAYCTCPAMSRDDGVLACVGAPTFDKILSAKVLLVGVGGIGSCALCPLGDACGLLSCSWHPCLVQAARC